MPAGSGRIERTRRFAGGRLHVEEGDTTTDRRDGVREHRRHIEAASPPSRLTARGRTLSLNTLHLEARMSNISRRAVTLGIAASFVSPTLAKIVPVATAADGE